MQIYDHDKEELKGLMDRVREIASEPRNTERVKFWQPQPDTARDHWRGTPRPRAELPRAPITVEPEIPMWAAMLGFKVDEFYTNPATYLKYQLKMMIYRYEHWADETCIGTEVPIWLGATFESSLLGAETIYAPDASPWLDREPVIVTEDDLDRLEYPDFRTSGLMPRAHQYYEVLGELLDDDFKVTFPEWGRSPFGVAFHIRRYEQLALDMATNPDFTHRMMRFITDARKHWVQERAKFLDMSVEKGNLYNDEVNTPTLSPKMFEEFVLPYEQELSAFHGGILYWHSCGETTRLAPLIAKIPNLEMFHVGPWTDPAKTVQAFEGKMPLEFCLHPLRDVQQATEAEMESKLVEIAEACGPCPYTVRADGLQVATSLQHELDQVDTWIKVADRVLRNSQA
ncbi:hypothetical protein GF339_02730 [candidate division KSB3 bacterium]|uniref:Uroporphyrinogen decarboxylase (URO-D) domain-containing protein n=1 Tax=candidate division KSB3 bacterium TaxID=2044937 RepID=A0A9D5JSU5_9BACT|nr:hypothetical protein [candidate division KSB3 bacterium]MBD3323470.1 hypothetical protein [candidate division KSB3 bacterium]